MWRSLVHARALTARRGAPAPAWLALSSRTRLRPAPALAPALSSWVALRSYASEMLKEKKVGGGEDLPDISARGLGRRKRFASKSYLDRKERKRFWRLKKQAGTPIEVPELISAKGISRLLGVRTVDILKILIKLGIPPQSSEEVLATEVADIVISEFNRIPVRTKRDLDLQPRPTPTLEDKFPPRPPVVVILGHVNHGKTTLLDALRNVKVKRVDQEAGGITQHMGAFTVKVGKETLTILDTPGHEAFERIRERGAVGADIAVLVVDAERSVQDQTRSSIEYLRKYNVPAVVALTKMDKPNIKPKRTLRELREAGLDLEDETGTESGTIPVVRLSAVTGEGLSDLKELLLMKAGLMDIKAPRDGNAEVIVLETRLDRHKGVVASGIVRCGTLKRTQPFVVATVTGKVRWLFDSEGKALKEALPGHAIELTGFDAKEGLPEPGDTLFIVRDEKKAREVAQFRLRKKMLVERRELLVQKEKEDEALLEEQERRLQLVEQGLDPDQHKGEGGPKVKLVPFILKGDVVGSVEAVLNWVETLPKDDLDVRIIRSGVGAITETDINVATIGGMKPIILGFGTAPVNSSVLATADDAGIRVVTFPVIYSLMEWIRKYCSTLLPPDIVYEETAYLLVKQVFSVTIRGTVVRVAGCSVHKGIVRRGSDVRIHRDDELVYEGKVRQLRHLKDEVKEVHSGQECGVMFSDAYQDFREGDRVSVITSREIPREFMPEDKLRRRSAVKTA